MKKLLILPILILLLSGCQDGDLGARTSNFLKKPGNILQPIKTTYDFAVGGGTSATADLYVDVSAGSVYSNGQPFMVASTTYAATGTMIYYSGETASLWDSLGIGSTGQVIKVAGGLPTWAADAGGSGWEYSTTTIEYTLNESTGIISLDVNGTLDVTGLTTMANASTSLLNFTTGWGTMLNSDVTGDLTGNADTATALGANGGNCNAGEYALGVDASGAVEDCTDATTEISTYAQPLEATLTDIADGTIAENLVNTANPWADNEVADDITASNYTLTSTTTLNLVTTADAITSLASYPDYKTFSYSTSTSWTGTTTIPLGVAGEAETWVNTVCYSGAGTLNVQFSGGIQGNMDIVNATTATTTTSFSTNNVLIATEKRSVDVGTPASSPTYISCTVKITR